MIGLTGLLFMSVWLYTTIYFAVKHALIAAKEARQALEKK